MRSLLKAVCLLFLITPSLLVGDVLVDQNGSKVEGTVVEFDGTYVVFKNDTDKITYRFNVSELSTFI